MQENSVVGSFFSERNMDNPWKVDTVQAFLCLKCPQCDFYTKEDHNFKDHAICNHPMSYVLFGKSIII